MSEPNADYWLNHWGTCSMKPCNCNSAGNVWLGQACQNWTPLGARSREELLTMQKQEA